MNEDMVKKGICKIHDMGYSDRVCYLPYYDKLLHRLIPMEHKAAKRRVGLWADKKYNTDKSVIVGHYLRKITERPSNFLKSSGNRISNNFKSIVTYPRQLWKRLLRKLKGK